MKLPLSFYQRDTKKVAKELLGKRLCHKLPNGKILSGIIVETEAYLGVDDPACHTWKGKRTDRVHSMYLAGGHAYIYMIYGMYFCLNVVTKGEEEPEAVLIRAVMPLDGFLPTGGQIKPKRAVKRLGSETKIANGPGKLCRAFHIDRSLDGTSLRSKELWIEEVSDITKELGLGNFKITAKPRVGVDYAGKAAKWPLRFYVKDSAYISKK